MLDMSWLDKDVRPPVVEFVRLDHLGYHDDVTAEVHDPKAPCLKCYGDIDLELRDHKTVFLRPLKGTREYFYRLHVKCAYQLTLDEEHELDMMVFDLVGA